MNTGEVNHTEETDIAQVIRHLNDDTTEHNTKMSAIDMKARLNIMEIPAILAIDNLVALGVFPQECLQLTRQKKRLSVSKGGQGRAEIVRIAVGNRDDPTKPQTIKPTSPIGLFRRKNTEVSA